MNRFTVDDGVELAFESHGEGPPLLLLTGLGYGAWSWVHQIGPLAREHHLIALDNRGAGESDKPDRPYTIARMADDAAALLAHLGLPRANVVGISMGGFIAQELALRHPGRVASLMLGCTSFGGKHHVAMSAATYAQLMTETGTEPPRPGIDMRFSDRFIREHGDRARAFIALRAANLSPRHAWKRQVDATLTFDVEARLSAIDVPTLVLSGEDDPIVPVENARRLAARIAGAELRLFPGARHLFFVECADECNHALLDFLRQRTA